MEKEFGPLQAVPISNDSDSDEAPKHSTKRDQIFYSYLFGVIISVIGGMYLGFSAPTIRESYNYCLILLTESILCVFGGLYAPSHAARRVCAGFVIYLVICGLTTPVGAWLGQQIP